MNGNEVAWVCENTFGTEPNVGTAYSIETFAWDDHGDLLIKTCYPMPETVGADADPYAHLLNAEKWATRQSGRRLAELSDEMYFAAREAGAADPEQLGEQLALLLDGASARNRVLNADTFATAAAIATVLIDNAIPAATEPVAAR